MSANLLSTRYAFEHWLASMDDRLESFLSNLPSQHRQRLEFSPASLDELEALILERYPDTQAMLDSTESRFAVDWRPILGKCF